MDFRFTEEQLLIQDVARRIAQERIAPSAEGFDKSGEFPLENIRLLGENGLMGIEVPAEYGGAGMDPVSYVLAMVEIAAADAAHSTIMSVNNSLFCNGILTHGTEAQKQKYVRAIAEGKEIGAFALTEPQSGSDATAMRCRAVKQADGRFIINGKKSWITSGPVAKYIVLFAMTDPDKGARGITAFLVDTDKAGFHRGKTEPKLGIRASATCEIEFQDYVATADEVLGQPGHVRVHRAVGVRRLVAVVDVELAGLRVEVRDDPAGLERGRMTARVDDVAADHRVGLGEGLVGGGLVAGLPGRAREVVALAGLVVTDQRGVGIERLARVDDRGQRLVLDVDQAERVVGRVLVGRDHEGDLLALETDLVPGEHRLGVVGDRRHPGEQIGRASCRERVYHPV